MKKGGEKSNRQTKPYTATEAAIDNFDVSEMTSLTKSAEKATGGNVSGRVSEVHDTKGPTIDPKTLRNIFRFLDLPSEIRNQIYKNLLVVKKPTWGTNHSYYDLENESQPVGKDNVGFMSAPIGTLRCHTPRVNTSKYHVSILRVNRQTHREAIDIFYMENTWISVHVNKAGVGRELKERGFAPMRCSTISRPRYSSMSVAIIFPSLIEYGEIDSFVITLTGVLPLQRALWTVRGVEEMYVVINIQSDIAGIASTERSFIGPFLQHRGISKAIVCGAHVKVWNTYLPYLMKNLHSSDDEVWQDLGAHANDAYANRDEKCYEEAEVAFEYVLSHLSDCFKVYGPLLLGHTDNILRNEILPLAINVGLDLAEVKNKLGRFHHAIKYSNYAMNVIPIDDFTTAPMLLARSQAYISLKSNKQALSDLLSARNRDPQNADIKLAITKFKKSLHPDRAEALKAFKNLCLAIEEEELERVWADFNQAPGGVVVTTRNPDGTLTVEHRI